MITKRIFINLLAISPITSFAKSNQTKFDITKELENFRKIYSTKQRLDMNSTLCGRIHKNEINNISKFFKNIHLEHTSNLFEKIPEELAWWLARDEEINVINTAIAIHETSHFLNLLISNCNGYRSYFFQNKITTGIMRKNDYKFSLSNYSKSIENNLKNIEHHFYFENYIEKNKSNTIYTIIDELNSFVAASEFESAVSNGKFGSFVLEEENKFSGNIFAAPIIACYILIIFNEIKNSKNSDELAFLKEKLIIAHAKELVNNIINLYKKPRKKTGIQYNDLGCMELEKLQRQIK